MSSRATAASKTPAPPPPLIPAGLKAERIQLRQLPGWTLSTNRRTLRRAFRFSTQKEALAFLQLALATAELAPGGRRCPVFKLRGEVVTIALPARGPEMTAADLELARSVSLSA